MIHQTPADSLAIDIEPQIQPEQVTQLDLGSSEDAQWQNLNAVLNTIADEQRVEVGSWDWVRGGNAAWAGSSGEQSCEGWDHTYKVDDDYVRWAIANSGHRRDSYADAPFRSFPYNSAGRPKGWKPEMQGDLMDGTTAYFNSDGELVIVSGPDAEHMWLEPLWALMDGPQFPVRALGTQQSSGNIAKIMATLRTRSVIGMIRNSDGDGIQPYPWTYGDRANSRILSTIIEAFKRGCLEAADVPTCVLWIRDVLLPFYERAPGISNFPTSWAPPGMFTVGTFNGLYWILPVFFDAAVTLGKETNTEILGDRFMTIARRLSKWAGDLEAIVPDRGFDMSRFFIPDAVIRKGNNGKPIVSIAPFVTEQNIHFDDGLSWEMRSIRACSTAAHVGGEDHVKKAEAKLRKRYVGKTKPEQKVWLVDPFGKPME